MASYEFESLDIYFIGYLIQVLFGNISLKFYQLH